ncbi:MAG: FMN-binding glutamate synthase family protein [Symbiobacteriaceae bacterium]
MLAAFGGALLALVVLLAAVAGLVAWLGPGFARRCFNRLMVAVLSGPQDRNQMLQWLVLMRNTDPEQMLAIMRRAETGKPFSRPYGATRPWMQFEQLVFVPAQIGRLPRAEPDVDTRVTIGPTAARPLHLKIPIMITGMAYGLSLTREAKIALARASAMVGTATNSGESGFLADERRHAKHYIVQYNRGGWNIRPEQLRRADAIEIQFGQGADASAQETTKWSMLDEPVRRHLGLESGQDAVIHTRFPHVHSPEDLRRLVDELRQLTGGVPIGVKVCAGDLEADLRAAVAAGVDFVTIDGAKGSTGKGYLFAINDFGLPILYAIPEADRILRELGVRDRVTLIVSGGLRDGADFLKALALGADAVYVGTAILLAMIQAQIVRLMPYAPPYELFITKGRYTHLFDGEQAAIQAANYLKACVEEMVEATRALGHARLADVNKQDLRALSREVAEITGVPLAYRPRTAGLQAADRPSPLVAAGRATATAPGSAGDGSALHDGTRREGSHPDRRDGPRSVTGGGPGQTSRSAGRQDGTVETVGAATRDRGGQDE